MSPSSSKSKPNARSSSSKSKASARPSNSQSRVEASLSMPSSKTSASASKLSSKINAGPSKANSKAGTRKPMSARPARSKTSKVVLLSGGNPQVAKGDGDAPVQAYITAMPGWKQAIGRRLDTLITRLVPHVRKAVKWNSPFYGIEGQGWFLSYHVFARYVKVCFFSGTSLTPVPPGGTTKSARWIDIHESDFNEALLTSWIRQSSSLPGWLT